MGVAPPTKVSLPSTTRAPPAGPPAPAALEVAAPARSRRAATIIMPKGCSDVRPLARGGRVAERAAQAPTPPAPGDATSVTTTPQQTSMSASFSAPESNQGGDAAHPSYEEAVGNDPPFEREIPVAVDSEDPMAMNARVHLAEPDPQAGWVDLQRPRPAPERLGGRDSRAALVGALAFCRRVGLRSRRLRPRAWASPASSSSSSRSSAVAASSSRSARACRADRDRLRPSCSFPADRRGASVRGAGLRPLRVGRRRAREGARRARAARGLQRLVRPRPELRACACRMSPIHPGARAGLVFRSPASGSTQFGRLASSAVRPLTRSASPPASSCATAPVYLVDAALAPAGFLFAVSPSIALRHPARAATRPAIPGPGANLPHRPRSRARASLAALRSSWAT